MLIAGGVAAGALVAATAIESLTIHLFHLTPTEWLDTNDVVLAIGLGVATWLWVNLRMTRSRLQDAERQRVVLDTQLSVAADIQAQLLPAMPAPRDDVSWAARMQPAGKIGGDYYDVVELSDGSWLFLVADISGKGIPAALLLAYTRAVFHQAARENPEPVAVCQSLSDALHADTGGTPYVTCVIGRLEPALGRLTCVNAGHPAGLIIGTTGLRRLDTGGVPAGLLPHAHYEASRVDLWAGDLVVFVTDGVAEALAHGVADLAAALIARRSKGRVTAEGACQVALDLASRAAARGEGPPVDEWQDDRTVFAFRIAEHAEATLTPVTASDAGTALDALLPRR